MEWTEEITLNFIEVYRSKEILWDTKHPKYYNKIKKNDAWEELAMGFHTTVDECKKKINALLSALRREKAKIKKSLGTGTGLSDVYESGWFAFKSLLFLWDKNKIRKTQSTIENEVYDDDDDEEEKETSDNPSSLYNNQESAVRETQVCTENEPLKNLSEMAPPNKRRKKRDHERLDEAFKILSKASASAIMQQEQTECQIFGNLVAKKLSKYSSELQIAVQQDIMNILFQADRSHINQTTSYFNHPQSYRTHTQYPNNLANSTPQLSQTESSILTVQPLPSPAYSHSSSISDHSNSNSTIPVNSTFPHHPLDVVDIGLQDS